MAELDIAANPGGPMPTGASHLHVGMNRYENHQGLKTGGVNRVKHTGHTPPLQQNSKPVP
jgi:hypothetical protein